MRRLKNFLVEKEIELSDMDTVKLIQLCRSASGVGKFKTNAHINQRDKMRSIYKRHMRTTERKAIIDYIQKIYNHLSCEYIEDIIFSKSLGGGNIEPKKLDKVIEPRV